MGGREYRKILFMQSARRSEKGGGRQKGEREGGVKGVRGRDLPPVHPSFNDIVPIMHGWRSDVYNSS